MIYKKSDVRLVTLEVTPTVFSYDRIFYQVVIDKSSGVEILRQVVAKFGKELLAIKNIRAIVKDFDSRANAEYTYAEKAYQDICSIYNGLSSYDDLDHLPTRLEYGCTLIRFSIPNMIENN